MRFINETTAFKVMVDGHGVMLSVTTKKRSFNFFLSPRYVGEKVAPTTDPFPGIVEICGYDIDKIIESWDRLYRVKITRSVSVSGETSGTLTPRAMLGWRNPCSEFDKVNGL